MDFALRVERRSAFGYALGRALCPTEARSQFMRHFAMVLARPGLYREFIREYEALFPQHVFVPQGIAAPMVHLRRLVATSSQVANLSAADILRLLFVNRIPPTWVDHAYTFGVVYLSYHFTASALTREAMLETDNDRHERLQRLGLPQAITAWDGWYTPSPHDRERWRVLQGLHNRHALTLWDTGSWFMYMPGSTFDLLFLNRRREHDVRASMPSFIARDPAPLLDVPPIGGFIQVAASQVGGTTLQASRGPVGGGSGAQNA
ncbi:hypothetical protein H0H92_013943, partial [Tricholoma furcatifolium]